VVDRLAKIDLDLKWLQVADEYHTKLCVTIINPKLN
jgi:hypothetical protein